MIKHKDTSQIIGCKVIHGDRERIVELEAEIERYKEALQYVLFFSNDDEFSKEVDLILKGEA
jgi:hypothetical protein